MVVGFGLPILIAAALLMLPAAAESGQPTSFVAALFTATSAICVTGLIVVDTPEYWSTLGEVIILVLIQLGGLGIMTVASLLSLTIARRLGLRMQLSAQAETKALGLGEVRGVVTGLVKISFVFEFAVAVIFSGRLILGYGEPVSQSIYLGVFHAVSAFNNAGFSLFSDSLVSFATDPWINVPIMVAVVCGGIGFPVLFEVGRRLRGPHRWSLHTKITVLTYGVLFVLGASAVTAIEWTNGATLGALSSGEKLLVGLFHGITPRTVGFNTLEVGDMESSTLLINDVLMFVGGGSASTAGGIKVTTFALLAFVILAEVRGEPTVHVMRRRLSVSVLRQALTITLLGVALVVAATIALLIITPFTLDQALFEATSAFGTVGLSTGITDQLPAAGQLLITLIMFTGRLGPITLASSLALRERGRRYELPKERPIVG